MEDDDRTLRPFDDVDLGATVAGAVELFELIGWDGPGTLRGVSYEQVDEDPVALSAIELEYKDSLLGDLGAVVRVQTHLPTSGLGRAGNQTRSWSIRDSGRGWSEELGGDWRNPQPARLGALDEALVRDGFELVAMADPVRSYVRLSPRGSVIEIQVVGHADIENLAVVPCEDPASYQPLDRPCPPP